MTSPDTIVALLYKAAKSDWPMLTKKQFKSAAATVLEGCGDNPISTLEMMSRMRIILESQLGQPQTK